MTNLYLVKITVYLLILIFKNAFELPSHWRYHKWIGGMEMFGQKRNILTNLFTFTRIEINGICTQKNTCNSRGDWFSFVN
ncbi:hypothetical protein NTGHW29_200025 [Candidatus Nitrotoga sp. HW29]|nr:hypothetical protein NTGHW29_200025 [Candidatus Nitrotoga sp. HW29]